MTTYEMIEQLIYNETISVETALKVLKDAYRGRQINKDQYEDLWELAKKYL